MMGMLIKVMQFLRRLSPLAPWRVLRTLDEVRELPVLRTQVKQGLTETKKLKKQMLEVQRRLDQRKELAALLTRVEQFQAVYKGDTRPTRSLDRALKRISDAGVPAHVRAVVAAAPLESDPCPYIVLYGTQLCRLQHEQEIPTDTPFWVPEDEVEVVREVPGQSNSAVVFLNSTGAHRASIPADAPRETDRYIYQVQLGPERAVRDALTARLPADHAQRRVQKDTTFKY